MFHPSSPEIEKVFFATFGSGLHAACITGLAKSVGASTIAECLAQRAALTGRRTLLLDLSDEIASAGDARSAAVATPASLENNPLTFDRLAPVITRDGLYHYRDKEKLRAYISGHLGQYDVVIVDAAPCRDIADKAVPGAIAAAACDGTVVIASGDSTKHDDISNAMRALSAVGATVVGLIVNNHDKPKRAAQPSPKSARLHGFLTGLLGRLDTSKRPSSALKAMA